MRRIGLPVVLALSMFVAPLVAEAQSTGKAWRIGVLEYDASPILDLLREGLRQLGYVERQNISFDVRNAEGKSERLPGLAADLVQLRVDIIVAPGTAATRAAKDATGTIPIVMAPADDPVRTGLIASLARPGGNVTGVSAFSREANAKRLQLLREVVPGLARTAVLWTPGNPGHGQALQEMEGPARTLDVQLYPAAVREPAELTGAFSRMVAAHVGGVIVLGDAMLFSQRRRIIDLAARNRLPATYFRKDFVEAGGLMSYGTDIDELVRRRAATYVDRILKGSKPADLPVEQPTKFELVINLKTAKALGLAIPQSILVRADEVIQ